MRAIGTAVMFACACSLGACEMLSAGKDAPAVIIQPTAESHAELQSAVSAALNGASVTIADDALTRDSTLIIESGKVRDSQGVPLNGRDFGKPQQFQLVKNGSQCVLVQASNGQRTLLTKTSCRPT